jgi:hypothetical protein
VAVPALAELWRRGQEGWPSRFVVVQFPNAPLLVGLLGVVVGIRWLATIGLCVWAVLELLQGVNWFRRVLGLTFLLVLFL